MRGQIWAEYLLAIGGVVLIALMAFSTVLKPLREVEICSVSHMRALSEIVHQELNSLRPYHLSGVECNLDEGIVTVKCYCNDKDTVKEVVENALDEIGANVTVVVR